MDDGPSLYSSDKARIEPIKAVHYNVSPDRQQRIRKHAQNMESIENRFERVCREKMTVFDDHEQYNEPLVKILSSISNMYYGHLEQILTPKHQIRFTSEGTCPVYSALSQAEQSPSNFLR